MVARKCHRNVSPVGPLRMLAAHALTSLALDPGEVNVI